MRVEKFTKSKRALECARRIMGKGYLNTSQIKETAMISEVDVASVVQIWKRSDRYGLEKRVKGDRNYYKMTSIDGSTEIKKTHQELWRIALFGGVK